MLLPTETRRCARAGDLSQIPGSTVPGGATLVGLGVCLGVSWGQRRGPGDSGWGLAALGYLRDPEEGGRHPVRERGACGARRRSAEAERSRQQTDSLPQTAWSSEPGAETGRSQPVSHAFLAASPASRSFQTRKGAANMAITFPAAADSCHGAAGDEPAQPGRRRRNQAAAAPRHTDLELGWTPLPCLPQGVWWVSKGTLSPAGAPLPRTSIGAATCSGGISGRTPGGGGGWN
ncbi:hypothetical protein P7K49_020960 [Saguinus oedipus]|uniref:Uncharacterized protein n=1 Tax=Saguinus oedipus TaxID=9490 RepID=A0ABQ9URC5_SAGOE|nr:hypothetical protein P7K49_020960 [Saguinus oedipus]